MDLDAASPLDEQIAERARFIGRTLGYRLPPSRIPHWLEESVHETVRSAAKASVAGPLRRLFSRVNDRRREEWTVRLLLDRLWLYPAGSDTARDVIQILQQTLTQTTSLNVRRLVLERARASQWSAHPAAREAALGVLETEQASPTDVALLDDLRAYPDVRTAIAERMLRFLQSEHLGALLDYLIRASTTSSRDRGARRELEQANRLLRNIGVFNLVTVLPPVFDAYLQRFDIPEARGRLLSALVGLGPPIIPPLLSRYDVDTASRAPIVRLLRQLVKQGHVAAVEALGHLIRTVDGEAGAAAGRALVEALRDRAAGGADLGRTVNELLQAAVRDMAGELLQARNPVRLQTAEALLAIEWEGIDTATVEAVVAGTGDVREAERLRHGGPRVTELLLDIAESPRRPLYHRATALEQVGRVYGIGRNEAAAVRIWALYQDETEDVLRLGALRTMARNRMDPPISRTDLRNDLLLYADRSKVSTRDAIRKVFEELFPVGADPS